MLNIKISSDDFFYMHGLSSLLHDVSAGLQTPPLHFVLPDAADMHVADVVFRDTMVSISIWQRDKTTPGYESTTEKKKIIIHIPFICKQDNLADLMVKLKKILLIASMDYKSFLKRENYKNIGLKKYLQLSLTESKILLLVGRGYDLSYISKLLNRSEKTINTHCRNATRKLGMLNRVEFYRYASFIANCRNKERNILCL